MRPSAGGIALVAAGGALGAAARDAVDQALPTAAHGWPWATLLINLTGCLALGVLLEALVRAGDDTGGRRRLRLVVGTGFLGAWTTYSTFAVETDLLVRAGRPSLAAAYVAASVVGGLVAAGAGIRAGAARSGQPARLPAGPDAGEAR